MSESKTTVLSALEEERDAAHAALRQIADSLGNGAFVGAECSPEFHRMVAGEVAAVVARLTGERDALQAVLDRIIAIANADGTVMLGEIEEAILGGGK
ncbi:MAG TPA: hypothetical protein VMX17_07910 [Candidatus Glassbacteria bacterium]|nr:hypothetical protein [Candidatus Glassbacteria bacterium]